MNQLQFLREQIRSIPRSSSEQEMETLVATYLLAKEQIEAFVNTQAEAKMRVAEIIDQTGISRWETASGRVLVPAPATVVAYDAHALDALAQSNKSLKRQIWPHRNESVRSGGIRITK